MTADRSVIRCEEKRAKKDYSSFWPEPLSEDGSFPELGALGEKRLWEVGAGE